MSVEIQLDQTNTIIDGEDSVTYEVKNEVIATEGVDLHLFVFNVTQEIYSHIATPYDVEAYPTDRTAAISAGLDYYRLPSVTKTFSDIATANEFAAGVRSRLQQLANALPQAQADFQGKTTYTFETASS
jgi:hypothetical protein